MRISNILKYSLWTSGGVFAFLLAFLPQTSFAATLGLTASSTSVNVGDTVTVTVNLDTQGSQIDGVDLKYVTFNPSLVQVQDSDSNTSGTQIQAGTLMSATLANTADNALGRVTFSQVAAGGQKYSGAGTLATITFKAVAGGTANIGISFSSGSTVDSNVASAGTDALTSVSGMTLSISGTPPPAGSYQGAGDGNTTSVDRTNSGGGLAFPGGSSSGSSGAIRLINVNGTFYMVQNGQKRGITNPGMLASYGFAFADAAVATDADKALPDGTLLTPGDGALVKSKEDPTVYLISNQTRYAFTSAQVFLGLGFKFSSVLLVTNPELQALPKASDLGNKDAAHLAGTDINRNGTVYWVGSDNMLHGYPSLDAYNSWHLKGDFSGVVPANAADMSLGVGELVGTRSLQ